MRFYAGAPVILEGSHAVFTVCVVDHQPRELTDGQRRALRSLARHAAVQLELRQYAHQATDIAGYLEILLTDDRAPDVAQTELSSAAPSYRPGLPIFGPARRAANSGRRRPGR